MRQVSFRRGEKEALLDGKEQKGLRRLSLQ